MVIFVVIFVTMKKANVADVKARLSEYLDVVAGGETVVICKRNEPVAELRPIAKARRSRRRPIGLYKGKFKVHASFFDPLPDDILDAFAKDAE